MHRKTQLLVLLTSIFGIVLPAPAFAQASADQDRETLIRIIKAIERGWEDADGAPFRQHYLDFDGARYIESGGQNEGLTDLVEHHVEPEGDAVSDLNLELTNIETHIEGGFAWAIADIVVTGTVNRDGRSFNNRGHETFLFRRIGADWKVVHTHSSTRPVEKRE